MPSTVYKGDLTEVSFGHETGLKLPHGYGDSFLFKHLGAADTTANTSVISFSGGGASTPCTAGILNYPVGMLTGCRLSIIGTNNFTADDSTTTGRTYSIMAHKNFQLGSVATITTTPTVLGTGYTAASNVATTTTGGGTGLTLTTTDSGGDGTINIAAIGNAAGIGYLAGDVVTVTGDFSEASCVLTNTDATVTHTANSKIKTGLTVSGTNVPTGTTVASINSSTSFELSAVATGGDGSATGALAFTPTTKCTVTIATIAASYTELTVTPALKTGTDVVSTGTDTIFIHTFGTPTMDVGMAGWAVTAASSSERVLTDQFVGLASTITLPETKVDLKRYHVVGLGRDVAVQVPGRFLNEGGSFEVNLHNSRWFYYALGMESVSYTENQFDSLMTAPRTLGTGTEIGETLITIATAVSTFTSAANAGGGTSVIVAGDYVIIEDTTVTDVISYDAGGDLGSNKEFGYAGIGGDDYFNETQTNEIRRIAAIDGTNVWLDDGLCFPHAATCNLKFVRFNGAGGGSTKTGSPHRAATGALTNPITRLLYSRSSVPSFAMEVSIRRRDAEGSVSDVTDDGASDTKQLTRVYKGCKVKDFSITADTDAALRMSVNFDSALCYTDTGRLETAAVASYSRGTKGDRYMAHRMFENTGDSLTNRKEAGIEKGTQKPFMFYNGTVSVAGVTLGQVVSFTITGNTGVQQFYTINGAATTDSATDQIPFGGSRNASLAVEGKTEYSMDCEIIVDDPVFYHKVRRAIGHDATTANLIRLTFTKPGTASGRESIDILLDDFVITEAPLPIPEDKGVIKAPLKILPKSMRVVATDTLLHS